MPCPASPPFGQIGDLEVRQAAARRSLSSERRAAEMRVLYAGLLALAVQPCPTTEFDWAFAQHEAWAALRCRDERQAKTLLLAGSWLLAPVQMAHGRIPPQLRMPRWPDQFLFSHRGVGLIAFGRGLNEPWAKASAGADGSASVGEPSGDPSFSAVGRSAARIQGTCLKTTVATVLDTRASASQALDFPGLGSAP